MVEDSSSANGDRAAWRSLAARWKSGCAVALPVFAAACGYVLSLHPVYRASLRIMLPVSDIQDPGERKNVQTYQADAFFVRSYADVVKDDGLVRRVIAELDLTSAPDFNRPPTAVERAVAKLKSAVLPREETAPSDARAAKEDAVLRAYKTRLRATNDSKSLILDLSFDAGDAVLASRVVNAHAEALVTDGVERRRTETRERIAWMKGELDAAAEEMRVAQNAVQLHAPGPFTTRDAAADGVSDLKYRQVLASSKQGVYESLLTHYQNVLAEEHFTGSGLRILSLSKPPVHPDGPKKALLLGAAAILALLVGVAAATFASLFDKESRPAAAARLGVPVLGAVNLPRRAVLARTRRLYQACFWEQVSSFRSALRSISPKRNALAVVSTSQGEGKSLMSAGLARAVAVGGARVVLVDTNMRRPRFTALPGRPDLRDVLEGKNRLAEAVVAADPVLPLFILPGSRVQFDAALLSGPKIAAVMRALRKDYDLVLLDTAPLDTFSDALAVADLVDDVLIVAHDEDPSASFVETVEQLKARSVSVQGVVFTRKRKVSKRFLTALRPYLVDPQPPAIWPTPDPARSAQAPERRPAPGNLRLPSVSSGPALTVNS